VTRTIDVVVPLLVTAMVAAAVAVWRPHVPLAHPGRALHRVLNCALGSGGTGSAAWSRSNEIAFARDHKCGTEIFLVRPDGSGLRPAPGTRPGDNLPVFSPDDEALLVSDDRGFAILRRGRRTELGHGFSDVGAVWAPDGRHVAYTHGIYGGPGQDTFTSTLYAAGRRLIGHELSPGTPAWAPSPLIAFAGSDGIYTIHPDGTELRRLNRTYFGFDPPAVTWSPDKRRIAYCSDGDLGVVDATSGRVVVRASTCNDAERVAFSPDGRHLAFAGHGWLRVDGRPVARL
jgi:Tol biopolymer transport system component